MQTTIAATQVRLAFEAGLVEWQSRLRADEWHFTRLREAIVHSVSPVEAFDSIGSVVELVLYHDDPDVRGEAAWLLLGLVRKADTTQVHPVLEKEWWHLITCMSPSQAEELKRWFRRASA